ncbi:DUF932 domain-containing protein [Candidatus Sumerlaeota bacterium]
MNPVSSAVSSGDPISFQIKASSFQPIKSERRICKMQNLTRAHGELYRRAPDERFDSLEALAKHCKAEREESEDRWHPPGVLVPHANGGLSLNLGEDGRFALNDWSFLQLCKIAGVSKDTVNQLSPETARRVLAETLPSSSKPLQLFTADAGIRSIHGTSYTRLYNADLIDMLQETATDFEPPQKASGEGTGLYCGEQDMFVFLIDPAGWAEIEDQAFAPGFFVWNSEVGCRSVGIQTFWFQAICQNHIVWDAVEVIEFKRKHTANVGDSLSEIRGIVESLVHKRDSRRDGFVQVMRKATEKVLGADGDEVIKVLTRNGIPRSLSKEALKIAEEQGCFTIFSMVDALTRLAGQIKNAGDRNEIDQKASALLALAA